MHIPLYPSRLEVLQRHEPAADIFARWTRRRLPAASSVAGQTDAIEQTLPLMERRSGSAAHTNLIIGLVVGFTLAAFIIGVCVFLCCYGASIRFSSKKHRHRRRSTSSKGSRNSKNSREAERAEGTASEGERGVA
ncbi:hypothetical protein Trco_008460 [Trichoderma cornu-damae]|uniref:Uncharacterized protein n=1 Tax=Trichoderma cornu-damae TaxID=654480 RepID=A0A9P8QFF1_9HYPO|nr:hypothetical protein Trco_008460 [Trichoderma cornu-damae]